MIFSAQETPIETGGILGIKSNIVSECVFDLSKNEYGKYVPNTEMINKTISLWQKDSINFGGIFHSHYPSGTELSQQDIKYIKEIMLAVKNYYSFLYFPIVIPQKQIAVHKASIKDGEFIICKDNIHIIA